jgi:large subunit ribosomal protein L4
MATKQKVKTTKAKTQEKVAARTGLSVQLFDEHGKIVGEIELPKEIFGQKENPALLAQAARVYLANQKPLLASTKTRSLVRGGGRKPWRQKGTGRARIGTIRAPHWRGGGVVFGPQPREVDLKLTKKMRQAALASSLSKKFKENSLVVVDKISFKEPKTKKASDLLNKLPVQSSKGKMLVLEEMKDEVVKSFRNIEDLAISPALDLNVLDVLKSSSLIFTREAIEKLKGRYGLNGK